MVSNEQQLMSKAKTPEEQAAVRAAWEATYIQRSTPSASDFSRRPPLFREAYAFYIEQRSRGEEIALSRGINISPFPSTQVQEAQAVWAAKELPIETPPSQSTITPPTAKEEFMSIIEKASKQKTIPIDPKTGRPYGTTGVAPTFPEQYKQTVQKFGYVKGTPAFGGYKTQRAFELHQKKRFAAGDTSAYYQSKGMSNLAFLTPAVTPYFTPISPYLLAAGGAEELVTPAGQKRIQQKQKTYQEKEIYGYKPSPTVAGIMAYGQPVAEVGIGLLGMRSQYKSYQAKKALKAPQKTQFFAEQTPMEDFSKVDVLAKTTKARKETYSLSKQIVKSSGTKTAGIAKGYIIEGGKITQKAIKQGKIKPFYSIGSSETAGTGTYVKEYSGIKMGKSIGEGSLSKAATQIKGDPVKIQKVVGAAEPVGDAGMFRFIGGTPKSLRIYKSGRLTQTATPDIFGIIKTSPISIEGFGQPIKISSAVQKSVVHQVSAISSAVQAAAPATKTSGISSLFFGVSGITSGTSSLSAAKTTQKPEVIGAAQLIAPISREKTEQKTKVIPEQTTLQTQETKQESRVAIIPSMVTQTLIATKEETKQTQGIGLIAAQIPVTKTKQKETQRARPPAPTFIFPQEVGKPLKFKIPPPLFIEVSRKKTKKEEPYDAFVKIDSTKPKKTRWVKVADNVSYSTALGIAGTAVDKSSLSSKFKVVRDKGKVRPVKDDNWSNISHKFRNYRIKKGKKVKTPNVFIEKARYRLDSPQERRKIQRARVSSLLIGSGKSKGLFRF